MTQNQSRKTNEGLEHPCAALLNMEQAIGHSHDVHINRDMIRFLIVSVYLQPVGVIWIVRYFWYKLWWVTTILYVPGFDAVN